MKIDGRKRLRLSPMAIVSHFLNQLSGLGGGADLKG